MAKMLIASVTPHTEITRVIVEGLV